MKEPGQAGARVYSCHFDGRTGTLEVDGRTVELSPMERKALAYLAAHTDRVVSVEELEREVWRYPPSVRSKTVSVTLRKVRAKIGPEGHAVLRTYRGEGFRLLLTGTRPGPPGFSTPLYPRQQAVDAVMQLLADGWRVVTIIGQGGVGKTRLAAQIAASAPGAMYVGLGGTRDAAGVRLAIQMAANLSGPDLAGFPVACRHIRLVILDEVEHLSRPLEELVPVMPDVQFLLTSRRDLGREDEAVFTLTGFDTEDGTAFAMARLRASRWQSAPDATVVQRLVEAVGGLPLAIEVALASSLPLEDLVQHLERGALPPTLRSSPLETTLDRSLATLKPRQTGLLLDLTACSNGLSDAVLFAWRGPDAPSVAETLGRACLLSRTEGVWKVHKATKTLLRAKFPEAARAALEDYQRWLTQSARDSAIAIFTEPARAPHQLAHLFEDIFACMRVAPASELRGWLWITHFVSFLRGPFLIYRTAREIVLQRAPDDPMLVVLGEFVGVCSSPTAMRTAMAELSEADRVRCVFLLAHNWKPAGPPIDFELPAEAQTLENRLLLRLLGLRASLDPTKDVREALTTFEPYPLLRHFVQLFLAMSLQRAGQLQNSAATWRTLIDACEACQLTGLVLIGRYGYADTLAELHSAEAAPCFRQVAELAIENGLAKTWAVSRAGVWLAVLGHDADARRFLEHAEPHGRTQRVTAAFLAVLDLKRGEGSGAPLVPLDFVHRLADGTDLCGLVRCMYAAESAIAGGDPDEAVRIVVALQEDHDTPMIRLWHRALRIRVDSGRGAIDDRTQ